VNETTATSTSSASANFVFTALRVEPPRPPMREMIQAADRVAHLLNQLWRAHRDMLQDCADATGRPMHQAIPGLPMIEPRNRT
jgi:hypothetical protein